MVVRARIATTVREACVCFVLPLVSVHGTDVPNALAALLVVSYCRGCNACERENCACLPA